MYFTTWVVFLNTFLINLLFIHSLTSPHRPRGMTYDHNGILGGSIAHIHSANYCCLQVRRNKEIPHLMRMIITAITQCAAKT